MSTVKANTIEPASGGTVTIIGAALTTPALGTPSSGTVTNLTGTASININGTVGATTPNTVAGTTGAFSGKISTTQGGTGADSVGITPTTGTDRGLIRITNTGGDTIVAAESSTGGQTITGSTAYDGILRTHTAWSVGSAVTLWGRWTTSGITVNGIMKPLVTTYAGLPSAATVGEGARAHITDEATGTFGAVASGGGSSSRPVFSNGVAWIVG